MIRRKIAVVAGFTALATAMLALLIATPTVPPLGAAPANPCTDVTAQSVQRLQRSIQRALRTAEADTRANGQTGSYAVAATNSRDLLARSDKRIGEAITLLKTSSPGSTTYAEGGQVKEYVRNTFEWLSQAGHWALISAAYHRSPDARETFEGSVVALGEAQRVFGESGRCFMAAYL